MTESSGLDMTAGLFGRRQFLVRSGLVAVGLGLGGTLLDACSGSSGGGGSNGASKKTKPNLNIGMNYVTSNFDPVSTTAISDYIYLRFIYDTLVSVDTGSPQPWLAESWKAVGDATHWQFKLKQGVKFSNGEPFNAEAVRFTFQRALDDPKNPWRTRIQALQKMEATDDHTIDFFLSQPVGNWPTVTSVVWIVPPKYGADATALVTKPVGTGPFTLEAFAAGQQVTLTGKKDYWGDKPKIQTVTLKAIPEESTRVSALLAGDVDVAYRVLPDFSQQITGGGKKIISVPSGQSADLFFQTTRGGPIADERVRQAIDFALDKKALFKAITDGKGRLLDGQLGGPNSIGHNPKLKSRPFDAAKAKQLLKDAGYNGEPIGFDYPIGRYFRDKETCEAITASLKAVGFNIAANPMDGGAWLKRLYTGVWGPINYWSIQDAPAYDLSWTMDIFRSNNVRKIDADPQLDSMLDKSLAMTDDKKRSEYLGQLAKYVQDKAYVVALWQDPGLYAVSPAVHDIKFLPSTYIDLDNVTVAA